MADTPKTDDADVQNMRKAFEKQILELRKDITKISDSMADRSARLASEAIETASARASRAAKKAAKKLGAEAHTVSEIVRENPGTTATALGAAVLFGFIVGVAVGRTSSSARWT